MTNLSCEVRKSKSEMGSRVVSTGWLLWAVWCFRVFRLAASRTGMNIASPQTRFGVTHKDCDSILAERNPCLIPLSPPRLKLQGNVTLLTQHTTSNSQDLLLRLHLDRF